MSCQDLSENPLRDSVFFKFTFQHSQRKYKFFMFSYLTWEPAKVDHVRRKIWCLKPYLIIMRNIIQAEGETCKFTLVCFDAINLIFHLLPPLWLLKGEKRFVEKQRKIDFMGFKNNSTPRISFHKNCFKLHYNVQNFYEEKSYGCMLCNWKFGNFLNSLDTIAF